MNALRKEFKVFGFGLNGNSVDIIKTPNEFYRRILNGIKQSENRISIASLYLGTGKLEHSLVNELELAVKNRPNLQVTVLLDYLRGTRPSSPNGSSSVSILSPLTCSGLNLYLYHTPALSGFLKYFLPGRLNEIVGLQHMKVYVFDNEVILSGANLSDLYFTNRQDRYISFNSSNLSNFYHNLLLTVASLSFKADGINRVFIPPSIHPLEYSKEFKSFARTKIIEFLESEEKNSDYKCQCSTFGEELLQLKLKHDAVAFPLVQMGIFAVDQDEKAILSIFKLLQGKDSLRLILSSGYFNFIRLYENLLVNTRMPVRILISSEKSNGFFGAKGFAGYIPLVYTHLLNCFMESVRNFNKSNLIQVYTYDRDNWTFHSKGFWIYEKDEITPVITSIGSPNYGERSSKRDLESQVVLISRNLKLQQQFGDEVHQAFTYATGIDGRPQIDRRTPVPIWIRLITRFIKTLF